MVAFPVVGKVTLAAPTGTHAATAAGMVGAAANSPTAIA